MRALYLIPVPPTGRMMLDGGQIIHMQSPWHIYISEEERIYRRVFVARTRRTHERKPWESSMFSPLISCSDAQLWPQGLTRKGLHACVCVHFHMCNIMEIYAHMYLYLNVKLDTWERERKRESFCFHNLKMASDSLPQLKYSSSRLLHLSNCYSTVLVITAGA